MNFWNAPADEKTFKFLFNTHKYFRGSIFPGKFVRVCASQTLKNEHEQLFVGYSL